MSNPRHAAPSRTAVLAGRVALGVVGAPVAMLAVAGPASAVELDSFDASDNRVELSAEDNVLDADVEMSELALPELELADAESLPGFDAVDVAGLSALGLPDAESVPALPELDTFPGTDSLPALGTDAFPGLDALPEAPELPVDLDLDLDMDLPEAPDAADLSERANLPERADLAEGTDLPEGTDVFAVSDLLGGIV